MCCCYMYMLVCCAKQNMAVRWKLRSRTIDAAKEEIVKGVSSVVENVLKTLRILVPVVHSRFHRL